MRKRGVVITGVGAVSPYGWGLLPLLDGLRDGRCCLTLVPDNQLLVPRVKTRGAVPPFDEKSIPREYRRTMPRMGIMGFMAAAEALAGAGITPDTPLSASCRDIGTCIASTVASTETLEDFFSVYFGPRGINAARSTTFFKIMGHAVASSLCAAFGLSGRSLSPAAACAGSLQALGLAYESIAFGRSEWMLAGGVEEFHPLLAATFDKIEAASHHPDPEYASRPFDMDRNGMVCSEGAGMFLLESADHAYARGAPALAEINGFSTGVSPDGIVFPDSRAIENCMREALMDAGIEPWEADLISAHATATETGDIAEGQAIERVFGPTVPVNSLKGYLGHCMAASGALELMAAVHAAREGFIHGTRNCATIDPRCGNIMLEAAHREKKVRYIVKNSFGLGGVNACLVITVQ